MEQINELYHLPRLKAELAELENKTYNSEFKDCGSDIASGISFPNRKPQINKNAKGDWLRRNPLK